MYTCMYYFIPYVQAYIHEHTHTHTYIHTYIHAYNIHTYMHTHIHTTHIHTHTHIHTYIHTYIPSQISEGETALRSTDLSCIQRCLDTHAKASSTSCKLLLDIIFLHLRSDAVAAPSRWNGPTTHDHPSRMDWAKDGRVPMLGLTRSCFIESVKRHFDVVFSVARECCVVEQLAVRAGAWSL